MSKLRVAVIGVGHLGQIHARLLAQVADAELVGVVDPTEAARTALAAELKVPGYTDHAPLLGKIDAAIVATPSRLHYEVANDFLVHGVHVFIEKPMTLNIGDADGLIAEAESRRLVLQVGHVERFNPAFCAAQPHVSNPKYIDAVRSGPFTCRSTDIGVVLDLMIHDIDIVLSLVGDKVASVQALGAAVIGPNEDWAQARITFAGGCVADLFASRVSWQSRRSMDILGREYSATIDFASRSAKVMQVGDAIQRGTVNVNELGHADRTHLKERLFHDYLPLTDVPIAECNPLLDEQREFVAAIQGKTQVRVTGADGRQALNIAERILAEVAGHRWEGIADGAVGPRFETRHSILPGPHWPHAAGLRRAG